MYPSIIITRCNKCLLLLTRFHMFRRKNVHRLSSGEWYNDVDKNFSVSAETFVVCHVTLWPRDRVDSQHVGEKLRNFHAASRAVNLRAPSLTTFFLTASINNYLRVDVSSGDSAEISSRRTGRAFPARNFSVWTLKIFEKFEHDRRELRDFRDFCRIFHGFLTRGYKRANRRVCEKKKGKKKKERN